MLTLTKDEDGLLGEWEMGRGVGGEHPGRVSNFECGNKTQSEIIDLLSSPVQMREVLPIKVRFLSGRVLSLTTQTMRLSKQNPHSHVGSIIN